MPMTASQTAIEFRARAWPIRERRVLDEIAKITVARM
jgi:hypothetical protein